MNKEKHTFSHQSASIWNKKYGRELTSEEIRDIVRNLTGFFKVLARWEIEEQEVKRDFSEEEVNKNGKEKIYFGK